MERKARVDAEVIQRAVLRVRNQNVLLDADLADLYGVDVRALNQAVARNADRFPSDFMFKLTAKEAASSRSQSVILDDGRGRHRKYLPHAFATFSASVDERFDAVDVALVEQRQYTEFAFDRLSDEMRTGFNGVESRFDRLERKLDQFIDTQSTTNTLVERRLTALEPRAVQE